MDKQESENSVLSGYRVLDLTDEKGMFCSRLLADMGAEVVRVEKAGGGSTAKPVFEADNLGKRSITTHFYIVFNAPVLSFLVPNRNTFATEWFAGYLVETRANEFPFVHQHANCL